MMIPTIRIAFIFAIFAAGQGTLEKEDVLLDNSDSASSREMAAVTAQATFPSSPKVKRSAFPKTTTPHICLAFLSCCDRTDLLNHTLAATIRHMEEDEPDFLNYEIAWVDNGSDAVLTQRIVDSYQIDHALRLPQNMGLAYGMNLLIFNLCKAPYILLLEEDWLYLDRVVATQTDERKRVIATSLALLETLDAQNITSFDERRVMGVFLRHESYESFLKFPLMDNWETVSNVNIPKELRGMLGQTEQKCDASRTQDNEEGVNARELHADIDYRIFCGDVSIQNEILWGSFTNGAGLYRRTDLMNIGRMYGEPGDAFHDRYVESNYAYRAAMHHCHSALRLTNDRSCEHIHDSKCTGAFHHIGGGRGTRPRNTKGTSCDDMSWNFFGTPLYQKFRRFVEKNGGKTVDNCSKEQLESLRQRNFRDRGKYTWCLWYFLFTPHSVMFLDAEDYRKAVKEESDRIFQQEQAERVRLKTQADLVERMLDEDPSTLRAHVRWIADKSNEEIREIAQRLRDLADSPHPLEGYFDSHGRPLTPSS